MDICMYIYMYMWVYPPHPCICPDLARMLIRFFVHEPEPIFLAC